MLITRGMNIYSDFVLSGWGGGGGGGSFKRQNWVFTVAVDCWGYVWMACFVNGLLDNACGKEGVLHGR